MILGYFGGAGQASARCGGVAQELRSTLLRGNRRMTSNLAEGRGGTAHSLPPSARYNHSQHVLMFVSHHEVCVGPRRRGCPIKRPPLVSKRPMYVFEVLIWPKYRQPPLGENQAKFRKNSQIFVLWNFFFTKVFPNFFFFFFHYLLAITVEGGPRK